jgi:hypothetical protein
MEAIAQFLGEKGLGLRSGGAIGADAAFERGALRSKGPIASYRIPGNNGMTLRPDEVRGGPQPWMQDSTQLPGWKDTASILDQLGRMVYHNIPRFPISENSYPQRLQRRNIFQVVGPKLDTPSKFTVAYTPTGYKGQGLLDYNNPDQRSGTNTAIKMSAANDVPVFNLHNPEYPDLPNEQELAALRAFLRDTHLI